MRKYAEGVLMALVLVFGWCKLLHMLLPYHQLGRLLITIWRMLLGDVLIWLVVFIFILIAFSLSIR